MTSYWKKEKNKQKNPKNKQTKTLGSRTCDLNLALNSFIAISALSPWKQGK